MARSTDKLSLGPIGAGLSARLVFLALLSLLPVPGMADAVAELEKVPYWQRSAGWWLGTNSYFDGDMNVRLREYHTITGFELRGDRVIETEYKFYPPGDASPFLSYGEIPVSQGVELVTVSEHIASDAAGSVRQETIRPQIVESTGMQTDVVAADSAIRRVIDPLSGFEHYRQYVSLNPPERRYVLNMGVASDPNDPDKDVGALRGFAVSRAVRIAAEDVEAERLRLRQHHAVGGIVSAGSGEKRDVSLIDNNSQ